MSKSCKCKEVECEECPEWIFTLADLIMCMMGLFVILWVLKPEGTKPGQQASELPIEVLAAIRDAFKYLPDPQSQDPVDVYMLQKKLEHIHPLKGPGEGGRTKVPRRGAEGTDPDVTSIRATRHAITGGRVLFEPGSAQIDPQGRAALDQVAQLIRGHRNVILVKGHVSREEFPEDDDAQKAMDLSLQRAQAVAAYLVTAGVEPEILRVQGCSTFEPVMLRAYTPDGRAQNRRAEVEATDILVEQFRDSPQSRPASSPTAGAPAPSPPHH